MEEVDRIVVHSLRELGVELDEISTLAEFKGDHMFLSCLTCLRSINPQSVETFPQVLPRGMSAKVNVTSEMANVIKNAGYKAELSYHQILYPSAVESRKILMWLLDAMPKKTVSAEDSSGVAFRLEDEIARELTILQRVTWAPAFSSAGKKHLRDVYFLSTRNLTYPSKGRKLKQVPGLEQYYTNILPLITKQPNFLEEVGPSIFEDNLSAIALEREKEEEWNKKGLGSGMNPIDYQKKKRDNISKTMAGIMKTTLQAIAAETKLSDALKQRDTIKAQGTTERKIKFQGEDDFDVNQATKLTEEEIQKKREEEILSLQEEITKFKDARQQLLQASESMQSNIKQLEALIAEEDSKAEKLAAEYKIKKKTYDLLPNAEKNIVQLKEISIQSAKHLLELAAEWEKHRIPKIEEYRKLKDALANLEGEKGKVVEQIKKLREEIKQLADSVRAKDEKYRELLETFNKLPKDITRSSYTNRILEIVKNVKKQKADIDKILIETKNLQKEINSKSDTLFRSFSVTDELIFADAKKDPTAKEAYKQLVAMNEHFKTLIKTVEEIGSTRNANLSLESKIEEVEQRTAQLDLERVGKDLKEIKAENRALLEKLKSQE